ncbi:MAG TPA: hypothetical protein PK263_04815 [bacterium]|nr:hypothetical protein [bacterium]
MEEEFMNDEESKDLLANIDQTEELVQEAFLHSIRQGGDFAKEENLRWLADTADTLLAAKRLFLRESSYAGDFLSLAADVSEECAESCETFFEDDIMRECALSCRNFVQVCRKILEENEETEEIEEDASEKEEPAE